MILDADATLVDPELTLGNYAGATLMVSRADGADASDTFTMASGDVRLVGSSRLSAVLSSASGVTRNVGEASLLSGVFTVTFNENATQADIDAVLRNLAYRNTSNAPLAAVVLDYSFSEATAARRARAARRPRADRSR